MDENGPKHVGIILDGNRRFAKKLMLQPWKGHEWGANKVKQLFEWAHELGVKELTLYAFSEENFNRPETEFNFLMDLFKKEYQSMIDNPDSAKIDEYGIRIKFIGRIHKFPEEVQTIMQELMHKTQQYTNYTVNIAMAYGGRSEIVDATKQIAEQVQEGTLDINSITEDTFSQYLYMADEPDLIIRTSEHRLSGFLLWQASYAELIFLPDKLWPEFEKNDFVQCIEEYKQRKRRFGK